MSHFMQHVLTIMWHVSTDDKEKEKKSYMGLMESHRTAPKSNLCILPWSQTTAKVPAQPIHNIY